jgi:hypothetical protein
LLGRTRSGNIIIPTLWKMLAHRHRKSSLDFSQIDLKSMLSSGGAVGRSNIGLRFKKSPRSVKSHREDFRRLSQSLTLGLMKNQLAYNLYDIVDDHESHET